MSEHPVNPFRPSFGVSPLILADRHRIIDEFRRGLIEGPGNPLRASLISGPRGTGKTVLLNEFEDAAADFGWITIRAYPDRELVSRLTQSTIPEALLNHPDHKPPGHRVTGVSVAGLGSIRTDPTEESVVVEPHLIGRLRDLVQLLAAHGAGVLLTLDEVQSAPVDQVSALATAIQDVRRDELPIAFSAAGLPEGVEKLLQHPGTTFLRRAENILLGPLTTAESQRVLIETAAASSTTFSPPAAARAAEIAAGYPYLVQVVGSLAWTEATMAGADDITPDMVAAIEAAAIDRMGRYVHAPSLRQVPDSPLRILYVMAELEQSSGHANVATGDIAAALNQPPAGISMARKYLLEGGFITAPRYGYVAFALPYLGDYLRAHPELRP